MLTSNCLNMPYSAGKTHVYKLVRRKIAVICPHCWGCGKDFGTLPCSVCNGTGDVEKYINEIVHNTAFDVLPILE